MPANAASGSAMLWRRGAFSHQASERTGVTQRSKGAGIRGALPPFAFGPYYILQRLQDVKLVAMLSCSQHSCSATP